MYHKSRSYDVWFLGFKVQRTKFFVILGYYCPLTLLRTQKSQFWKNNKNAWRYYHFTLMYHKWWANDAWFLRHQVRQTNCFHFRLFFLLLTPNSPRNIKFKKMKKAPGDNIILHKCTKNHDYMLRCSEDMAHDECNCSNCSMRCVRLHVHVKAHMQVSLHVQCIACAKSLSKVLSLLFCSHYIFLVKKKF